MLTKLAIITDDIEPLIDVIKTSTKSFSIKKCTTNSKKTCFVIIAEETCNKDIYTILNGEFDVRFVDPNYVFKTEEDYFLKDIERPIKVILQHQKENEEDEFKWLNVEDERFKEIHTDSDYFIDVSHTEYKKNGYLKFFIKK